MPNYHEGDILTLETLKALPPCQVFATGLTIDNRTGVNMTGSDKTLRWVATRGGIHDWAIYIHFATFSEEYVKSSGDKIHSKDIIKKLVPCDDEAFAMYRH